MQAMDDLHSGRVEIAQGPGQGARSSNGLSMSRLGSRSRRGGPASDEAVTEPEAVPEGELEVDEVLVATTHGEDKNELMLSHTELECKCLVCQKLSFLRCSICKTARYCNSECQHRDWKRHKRECESFLRLSSRCLVCQRRCALKCSKCNIARYCSSECQHRDWNRHKDECMEFRSDDKYLKKIKDYKTKLLSGGGSAGERLYWASNVGSIVAVRMLLAECGYVFFAVEDGDNALTAAASWGYVNVV